MNQPLNKGQTYSAVLYQRALAVMPGGCSRNTVLRKPYPLYADCGQGCYLLDKAGVSRIDYSNNLASLIHGHAHPAVVAAVTEQLQKGTACTLATESEVRYAEHLCSRNEGFEQIRFVNSGTEAVMCCLKAARAHTNKPKIAKVEGAYHGSYDYAEVSQTATPENWGDADSPCSVPVVYGTPEAALNDVVVIPFNDTERAITILDSQADEIACVLVDLLPHRVSLSPVSLDFITKIFQWTRKNNALLVFDEVVTFRTTYGGAQEWFDIRPDLTALGKMIGGGFPVGAIAGRRDIMQLMNPLSDHYLFPLSGTFSANPITMVAGLTAMEIYNEPAVQRLNTLGERARNGIVEAIRIADVPFCVTGAGSLFRVHIKTEVPENYRAAFLTVEETDLLNALLDYLLDNGIMMINTCTGALSTAMTEKEIDITIEIFLNGFREINLYWQHERLHKKSLRRRHIINRISRPLVREQHIHVPLLHLRGKGRA